MVMGFVLDIVCRLIMLCIAFSCDANHLKEVMIMKTKKEIFIVIGSFLIVAIIAILLLFLHYTSNIDSSTNVDLSGTWRIISRAGTYVENEVVEFQNNEFRDYKNGETTPNLTSAYNLKNDRLELKDISKVYYIAKKTENYLIFIDDSDKSEWKVIRNSGENVSKDWLLGDWNVIMHGDSLIANEKVTYDKDTIKIYKDDSSEPSVTSQYSWKNDNVIYADVLSMNVYLYYVNEKTLIMRQEQDGYVWELTKD